MVSFIPSNFPQGNIVGIRLDATLLTLLVRRHQMQVDSKKDPPNAPCSSSCSLLLSSLELSDTHVYEP